MSILNYKYRNLEVTYEIEDEVLEYVMPKFICQPLVENTFKHGFAQSIGPCRITVGMRKTEEGLEIWVKDNGSGMEPEMLDEIRQKIELLKQDQTISIEEHIGILNTARRIFLHYGTDSVFEMYSVPGEGMVTRIQIPIKDGAMRAEG